MIATIVYDNKKDRELLDLIESKFPIFMNYINFNTTHGRKEAFRVKSYWGAIKNPFVVTNDEDKLIKVFYSDTGGDSAIQQFINWLNNDCKN